MHEQCVDEWVEAWLEQLRADEPQPIGNEYVAGFATYMRFPGDGSIDTNRAKLTIILRGVPDEGLRDAFKRKVESLGGVEVTDTPMPPEGGWPDSWRLEFVNIPL